MRKLLLGLSFAASALVACGSASSEDASTDVASSTAQDLSVSGYRPSEAVSYATSHWDDGQGLCSEFTSRSLRAGGLDIAVLPWVPDLESALTGSVKYEEHSKGATSVSAEAGDVIIFSNARGADFCQDHSSDENNCGHTCLITVGGSSEDSILADCHNNAHHHIPIGYEVTGGYTTYRIYHVASAEGASADTVSCTSDEDCNGGRLHTGKVCSNTRSYCIKACHSDDDCPGSESCQHTSPHWTCQ